MLQVDVSQLNQYFFFYSYEKLWQVIDRVYFMPRVAVCRVKKAQAK